MSRGFRFYPQLWLGNKSLRACSPEARALWIDVLALMHPTGRLQVNGQMVSDKQIAALTGNSALHVRRWLAELGNAGVFAVDEGGMYSPRMVKAADYTQRAAKDGAKRVSKAPASAPQLATEQQPTDPPAPVPPSPRPASKSLAAVWWQSPAGWVRKGSEQAISMNPGETFEEFQCRLAARLPVGPHLDELTMTQVKMVEALTPKAPS